MSKSKLFNPYGGLRRYKPYKDETYSMNYNSEDLNCKFVNAQGTPVSRCDYKPEDVKPPRGEK